MSSTHRAWGGGIHRLPLGARPTSPQADPQSIQPGTDLHHPHPLEEEILLIQEFLRPLPLLVSNLQAGMLVAVMALVSEGSGMDRCTGPDSWTSVPLPVKRWTLMAAMGASSSQVLLAGRGGIPSARGETCSVPAPELHDFFFHSPQVPLHPPHSPLTASHPTRPSIPLPLLSAPMKDGKPFMSCSPLAVVSDAESWLYVELRGRRAALRWNCTHGWLLTPNNNNRCHPLASTKMSPTGLHCSAP